MRHDDHDSNRSGFRSGRIQVLAYVPPEFGRDDPRGHRVIAMNAEVYGVARVENAYFCLLGCWLTFVRLPLAKISNDFRRLPELVVQGSVEPWGVIDVGCFRSNSNGLVLRGLPCGWSVSVRARRSK